MYLIGYDIGSSSIKAAAVEVESGRTVGVVKYPETEMAIHALHPDWAEQDPDDWWNNVCRATRKLLQDYHISPGEVKGIGIAYQMHGLVLVDSEMRPLRPSIIWCDSRAVDIGNDAFEQMGHTACLQSLLNSPGNFTASKLRWVQQNEPELYDQAYKFMLPGDYIALKLTGQALTTASGLSEGILWDFRKNALSEDLLNHYGIDQSLAPSVAPTCGMQGNLSTEAAKLTGLAPGTPVTYRAGDQPNNALSLNTLHPGEVAATGGTSGVVYGVVDKLIYDEGSRVNSFVHVNHEANKPRIGVLLCINGAGIQHSWMKHQVAGNSLGYGEMERLAGSVAVGAEGLSILPFGNGAERMLNNRTVGGHIHHLQFNRHQRPHLFRAALEGVAFAFVYGMNILKEMGLDVNSIRVGNDNLFQSAIFSSTIASLMGSRIEIFDTTGAVGAAKAAGVGAGCYGSLEEALQLASIVGTFEPQPDNGPYLGAYERWEKALEWMLNY
ncbi:MAG: carbohydrate kinase [Phaeodactylibacter sp.]|nr:carbohydrate kinase [Phaeodactylibacter sp.]MCB9050138.1 carbohydrate kinase [Lewinellaceae bacterium]